MPSSEEALKSENADDVKKILETHIYHDFANATANVVGYEGKEVLLLEHIFPDPALGVHAIDILTVMTAGGESKVVTCLFWGDCTEDSSHSSRSVYTVDIETETVKVRYIATRTKAR